ncbi:MAG: chorismate synthase [Propionibacteriaceae bacterium]|jgi:chorismate synthase|nr:chorismate synthase [Propionibacteriaceae bacterium]
MLRYLTAGESHGPALVATLDGLPAHVRISTADVQAALARRRLGYGRGARMAFEADAVTLLAGVRHGETLGSPVAVEIANTEWPKWQEAMAADPVDAARLAGLARHQPLTKPRPGHADLAGMQKYDWAEARPILERASARETAARVALGAFAQAFLDQALGVHILSHVLAIGPVVNPGPRPAWADRDRIDADPCRCADPATSEAMQGLIDAATKDGDTLGGICQVLVFGCPPGLGSHVQADRRLDARLAAAVMGIPAIKGVEIGAGFELATLPGSAAHDPMAPAPGPGPGAIARLSDRAGGIEGGMSTGQVITVTAAMKPIATVPHALQTVDLATGQAAPAHHQRSDICAVPAAGVIAEAVTALVLAEAALDKFGGDTVAEVRAAARRYRGRLAERGVLPAEWTALGEGAGE